ncbi:arylformamidase [Kordiimonas sp. SCSIO 12603]|uniref:arylformamidase n=1 Tax=Kordiimonas sp. SCSIO 12603 TaxID=2829596 RepID=UPI002106C4A0|nr:arylformamidase [Kordiimonas sp. SCSIO 12603]UTW57942.1 arylformamidase [Kordiimonas sp. SCSIO 12603]
MSRIYDISQRIRSDIPVWPGDREFSLTRTWNIDSESPVNVSEITLSTHTGTHADARLHFDDNGTDCADTNLAPYIGPAYVLDLSDKINSLVEPEHLQALPKTVDRVLVKLFKEFPHDGWKPDFPAISPDAIALLAEKGCQLIGTDVPSLDPQESKTLDAHFAVDKASMAILEGLVLDDVPEGLYELIALPLKIEGADGSPVRAILRTL